MFVEVRAQHGQHGHMAFAHLRGRHASACGAWSSLRRMQVCAWICNIHGSLQILHVLNPHTLEDLFGRPLPWQEEAFHLALVTRTTRSLSSLTGQAYPAYAGDTWMLLLLGQSID